MRKSEHGDRPYVICHLLCSIDGRIEGPFMGAACVEPALAAYAGMQQAFRADATAYGVTTTQGFVGSTAPSLAGDCLDDRGEASAPFDFVAHRSAPYYISIDPEGRIAWQSGTFRRGGRQDAHVIELLCGETPGAYRRYLRERGVSYVTAGWSKLDLVDAMRKLRGLFGIERMLVCGGGVTDAAFLSAELIDELSLVVAPVATGEAGVATLFDESAFSPASLQEFRLVKADKLDGDALHLTYRAQRVGH